MHTFSDTATTVPAFLAKLWRLVEDPDTNNLIYWQSDGRSFVIQNQAQFARELLPQNYKHNNMASFIRQLNMYGFHKIASIDNGGLNFDKDEMEFSHPCFQRDNPYLLEHIKRKIATTKQTNDDKSSIKPEAVNKVMNEVKVVRGRQDTLDSRFSAMKTENEALWREIAVLRQKHMKQQQIVNKLIQFLVTLVQPTRGGPTINSMNGVRRRFQLMINDVPESSKKRKKSRDSGPIIHELTEDLLDDCNYDNEAPFDSPTILSPSADGSTMELTDDEDANIEDITSPKNFKLEKVTPDQDSSNIFYEPNDGISYIIDNVEGNNDWLDEAKTSKQSEQIEEDPVKEFLVSYVKPESKDKSKVIAKSIVKSVPTATSQGASLLNTQQLNKKRPQLVLKMNKPIGNDGKVVQSVVTPNRVVIANKPSTSKNVKVIANTKQMPRAAPKMYTNKSDFANTEMPIELFESSDDANAPVLNSDINLASGSYNSSLSDDYTKKITPSSSKNLTVAKYNSNKNGDELQFNSPEDVNKQLDTIQGDLDSLKELFQTDSDYSLDANTLLNKSPGATSTPRFLLSPSLDTEILKIFGDMDAPFGLSMNDYPIDKRDDNAASGSELISYQPYNSIDLSEIMDDSTLINPENKQNENTDDDPLLNAPELNTPRVDKKNISFSK